jgi:hypothetical protein
MRRTSKTVFSSLAAARKVTSMDKAEFEDRDFRAALPRLA